MGRGGFLMGRGSSRFWGEEREVDGQEGEQPVLGRGGLVGGRLFPTGEKPTMMSSPDTRLIMMPYGKNPAIDHDALPRYDGIMIDGGVFRPSSPCTYAHERAQVLSKVLEGCRVETRHRASAPRGKCVTAGHRIY